MKFLRKKEEGFTLIEVMLVVIIIGIIAIIALPRLIVTKEQAAEKSCKSNIQAITTQLEQYSWDVGEYPDGTLAAFIALQTYFPANSSVSENCPLDGAALVYTPVDSDTDGLNESYTLTCPNGHHTP